MARKFYDLVKVTTATTGTGTITLGTAATGFLSFVDAGATSGDLISYAIEEGSSREVGWGDYNGTTLTRNVYASTNSNAAISLTGSATVRIVLAAEDVKQRIIDLDDYNNTHPATAAQVPVYDATDGKYRAGKVTLAPVAAEAGFTTIRLDLLSTFSNVFTIAEVVLRDVSDIVLTPSGAAASSTFDGAAANIIDGNSATAWSSNTNAESWVNLTFAVPVDPRSLSMTSAPVTGNAIQAPINFNVLGSSDGGVTWTPITSITQTSGWATTETRTFSLPDATGLPPIYSLLADVDGSVAPTDGQVPAFNASTGKFHFVTPASGSGGSGSGSGSGSASLNKNMVGSPLVANFPHKTSGSSDFIQVTQASDGLLYLSYNNVVGGTDCIKTAMKAAPSGTNYTILVRVLPNYISGGYQCCGLALSDGTKFITFGPGADFTSAPNTDIQINYWNNETSFNTAVYRGGLGVPAHPEWYKIEVDGTDGIIKFSYSVDNNVFTEVAQPTIGAFLSSIAYVGFALNCNTSTYVGTNHIPLDAGPKLTVVYYSDPDITPTVTYD